MSSLVRRLIAALTPVIFDLVTQGPDALRHDLDRDTHSILASRGIWSLLAPAIASSDSELRRSIEAFAIDVENEDKRAALQFRLDAVLSGNSVLAGKIETLLDGAWPRAKSGGKRGYPSEEEPLGSASKAHRQLEILRLIQSGIDPDRIADRWNIQTADVFRTNYAYSVGGVHAALIAEELRGWIDQLDGSDALLRRLEMVRLLRSGTPASMIAKQFGALEDYVVLIGQKFERHGLPGVVTDEDMERFQSAHPREIRICSYNLQGVRKDGAFRFRRMARELSEFRPDLIAFQEVVSGAGVDDTSGQVARWLTSMTGDHYRSHFTYCHQFMDKYPEGIAICAHVPVKRVTSVDLTADLSNGVKPSMDRSAQVAETVVSGKKVILVCVHLDHIERGGVRRAQAEKLLAELDGLVANADYHALVLAGDFNDTEDSPALRLLKDAGFRDTYRICHKTGGSTYAVPKPDVRIDYILVKGPAEVISADVTLNNPDFSDHLCVTAVLK